jgi:hypothetical protein
MYCNLGLLGITMDMEITRVGQFGTCVSEIDRTKQLGVLKNRSFGPKPFVRVRSLFGIFGGVCCIRSS